MTFPALLDQTCTVYAREAAGVDEDNNPILIDVTLGQWPCLLQSLTGEEVQGGRDTTLSDFGLTIGPNDQGLFPILDSKGRVDVDGEPYEVLGPPLQVRRPRRGVHHLRVFLRSVTG